MFEFVRRHNRLLQFVLVLLIFPSFVFFGIQGYTSFNQADSGVARVDGVEITRAEWDNAFRSQVERLRARNPQVDAKMFDTPQARLQVLEGLVRERVAFTAARRLSLVPAEERVVNVFRTDPQFAQLRAPNGTPLPEALAQLGMTSRDLLSRLQQDLGLRQVSGPITNSAAAPQSAASAALGALFQQREVQVAKFDAKDYQAKVTVDDAEVKKFYDDPASASMFMAPELAKVEYVVLDLAEVKKSIAVSDEDVRKFYDDAANASRFAAPEERRARHLLVKLDPSASADDKAKARAKAQSLLEQAQKNPAGFADLAKKNSDDTVSAANGGDLDFFARDGMVKPFSDAAYALQKGQLSGIVESEFGLHIIQLVDIRGGVKQPLDKVRAEIEDQIRAPQADKKFAEASAALSDVVDDQSDSLKPAADKLKLALKEASGVQRVPAAGGQGPLSNPKFLEAVFQADTLRSKRNTHTIELGNGQIAAARVLDYTPARRLPFEAVRDAARAKAIERKALEAAKKDGADRLAEWRKASEAAALPAAVTVSRLQLQGQPRALVDAVLREPTDKLPAWLGVDLGSQGYAVVKLGKVLGSDAQASGPGAAMQYTYAWGGAEELAYFAELRKRYKVSVTPSAAPAASAP